MVEAKPHDTISKNHSFFLAAIAVDRVDHFRNVALDHNLVAQIIRHVHCVRQQLTNLHAARRGFNDAGFQYTLSVHLHDAAFDLGVQSHSTSSKGVINFSHRAEGHALAWFTIIHQ